MGVRVPQGARTVSSAAERSPHTRLGEGSSPSLCTEDEAEGSKRQVVDLVRAGFESRHPPRVGGRAEMQRAVNPSPTGIGGANPSRRTQALMVQWTARVVPNHEAAGSSPAGSTARVSLVAGGALQRRQQRVRFPRVPRSIGPQHDGRRFPPKEMTASSTLAGPARGSRSGYAKSRPQPEG